MKLSSGSIEVHGSPDATDKSPSISSQLVPIRSDEIASLRSEIAELRLQLLASRDAVVGAEAAAARARARALELETQMHVRAVEVMTANQKADAVLEKLAAIDEEPDELEEEPPPETTHETHLSDVVLRSRAQVRSVAGRVVRRALR